MNLAFPLPKNSLLTWTGIANIFRGADDDWRGHFFSSELNFFPKIIIRLPIEILWAEIRRA
jgi:hypothetical protein